MVMQRAEAHRDHRVWASEIEQWQYDIEHWQKEQSQHIAELEKLVSDHLEALQSHSETVQEHRAEIAQHEHKIAQCESEQLQPDDVEEAWSEAHEQEDERQTVMRNAHERIKRHHHRTMGKLAMLIASLKAEM